MAELIAILALLVALVAPLTTWLVARSRNDHEARMAREARAYARREELYVELLEYFQLRADFAVRRHAIVNDAGEAPLPKLPSDAVLRRLRARAAGLASPAVQRHVHVLDALNGEFDKLASQVDHSVGGPDPEAQAEWTELRRNLSARRVEIIGITEALEQECNKELHPQ